MTTTLDLEPATRRLTRLIDAVPEDALERPTPCGDWSVGDLLDHIHGAALAFTAAAVKSPLESAPQADAANLPSDWRFRIPAELQALAEAWRRPEAWQGMTRVGGVDLPGEVAAVVGLDELVVHGWDLARATGLPDRYDGPGLEAVHDTVAHFRVSGVEGIFGPEVPVAPTEPLFDRTLGISGRDPSWRPPVNEPNR